MDSTPPPAPAQPQARAGARACQIHGIVLGPFGRCVICQRAESGEADDPSGGRKAMGILLLLAAGLGGVLVYKGLTGAREPPVRVAAPTPTPAAAPVVDERAAIEDARVVARVKSANEEQQRAFETARRKVPVSVYTTKSCELCGAARDWMTSHQIPFTDIDVNASPENLVALRTANPEVTVPTFVIDGQVLVGFGPGTIQAAVYRAAEKRVR